MCELASSDLDFELNEYSPYRRLNSLISENGHLVIREFAGSAEMLRAQAEAVGLQMMQILKNLNFSLDSQVRSQYFEYDALHRSVWSFVRWAAFLIDNGTPTVLAELKNTARTSTIEFFQTKKED